MNQNKKYTFIQISLFAKNKFERNAIYDEKKTKIF